MSAGTRHAKDLYQFLNHASDPPTLRTLGWWDFFRYDVPQTDDCRRVAAHAAYHLLIGDSGRPRNYAPRLLYAILGFCKARAGSPLHETQLQDAFDRLADQDGRYSLKTLEEWFTKTFDVPSSLQEQATQDKTPPTSSLPRPT